MKLLSTLLLLALSAFVNAEDISSLIGENSTWLKTSDVCPADIMGIEVEDIDYVKGVCDSNVAICFDQCSKGDAGACYNLAFTFQASDYEKRIPYSEALFLRACSLGSASACTNRASGIQKYEGDSGLECAIRTYEKSCDANDPWACTMLGFHLASGKGVDKSFEKALEVIKKSCLYGLEDPACQNAQALQKQIETALKDG